MKIKNLLIVVLLAVTVWGILGVAVTVKAAGELLSDDESAGLVFMREEEKLAHDVYVTLYQKWGLPVFNNIADSEAAHTSAVRVLLDRYGIADPAAGNGVGEFTDPALQALYGQLVEQGSKSISDALKVGAVIEEIDIRDLDTRLAQTDQADIELVYNKLKNASYNHLQAFTSTLQRQTDAAYTPTGGLTVQGGDRRWGRK